MSVLLIANIGNSDVVLADETLLPPLPASKTRWNVRPLGEELGASLPKYAPHLRLPLLGPTLRWLVEQEKAALDSLQLVLFATNQPGELTREDERQKDTLPMAEIAKKLLVQPDSFRRISGLRETKAALTNKQITIRAIDGSPADYSNMLAWYSKELPEVRRRHGDAQVFLEVSGGTPAMTAMLILAGVEVFGSDAHTLYINRGDSQPYEVSVAGELYAQRIRRMLRTQIQMYAYAVALRTLLEYERQVSSDERRRSVLAALLHYADRRLAFDFDEARNALSRARQATTGDAQVHVQYWLRQLESTDTSLHLAELIHSTRIKHSFGDYADFAQRLFRFQEAAFRHMADKLGMETSKEGQFLSQSWLARQPALQEFAARYLPPGADKPLAIDFGPSLNRVSLGAVVDYFLQNGAAPQWNAVAQRLHRLSTVADLRNKGLSGHGFQGISREKLEEKYHASLTDLLDNLERIYQDLFDKTPGESPYEAVNRLIDTLLL